MRAVLELASSGRLILFHWVERGLTTVGCNPECDLCLPLETAHAVQCVLRLDRDRLTLLNRHPDGTPVGEEVVTDERRLAAGDVIALGPMTATVRFEEPTDASSRGRTRTLEQKKRAGARVFVTIPAVFARKRWEIPSSGLSLGGDPTNDIVLDDPFVSAFHATLCLEDGRAVVRDLDSRNGVFVGEQKIREGEVPVGAQLRLGRIVAVLVAAEDPALTAGSDSAQLIGNSSVTQSLRDMIRRLAANDAPVLITGETGTGKEVVARLLAQLSPRAGKPFIPINCGSLGRDLIESELFGHEKGSFTGALRRRKGAFEAADQGTLFLDEIGELPIDLQPQLLRVIETGEVRRVGSVENFRVNVRLLAATNRKLEYEIGQGKFRADLFHRLHVLAVQVPPLRDHMADLEDLVRHFVAEFAPKGVSIELSEAAKKTLRRYDWPGNVRELRNVIQRAVCMRDGDVIARDDISFPPSTLVTRVQTASAIKQRSLAEMERDAIVAELVRQGGNQKAASSALGIARSTIRRKIAEYKIDIDELMRQSDGSSNTNGTE
jgi:DNA-binding NtrC family response regulator